MDFLIYLLIVEIIPLVLFILGALYESNSTNYNDMKFGYKNDYSIKNSFSWEYSNKIASKIFGGAGNLLFIVNAIFLLLLGEKIFTYILLFNLFIVILSKLIIDKIIKKKFNNK